MAANGQPQRTADAEELRERERQEQERQEQEEKEANRLPDDAVVDVEAEKKAANSDEILDRLDEELIGLVPVKTRIREIADLLVVDESDGEVSQENGSGDDKGGGE